MPPTKTAIYLDSNAGAPLKQEVAEALRAFLVEHSSAVSNPSSIHSHGRRAKRLVADAREAIAASLGSGIDPEQIIFTSSGTEANQLAIRSALEPRTLKGEAAHWILSAVEHDSSLTMVEWARARGIAVTVLPVDKDGRIDTSRLISEIRPETRLVSLVWVNNETGVIQDVSQISAMLSKYPGVSFHVDAAQAWGKLPIHLERLGASYVTFSAHKIGGLPGTGFLWLGRGVAIEAGVRGKQEKGRRGGTENLIGIVAAGHSAQSVDPLVWAARVGPLRERLESVICGSIPGASINGLCAPRVANTTNLNFEGVEGDGLVMALDLAGYSVSAGSACSSGVMEPSHVLMALGRSKSEAMSAVRISLHEGLSEQSLDEFALELGKIVGRMRGARETSVKTSVQTTAERSL